jgi:predicted transcriptional regulator of viral defense system
MNYLALSRALRTNKMYLFTSGDIKNLFPGEKEKTIKNNLTRWLSKGYFVRLRRNLYEFSEQGSQMKIPDLYVANRMYEPSYVSLETALSIYSIIPEVAAGVTSVTIQPTRAFRNRYGSFFYRSCKTAAFTGYKLMLYDGFKVHIADREKALVDFLYYRLRSGHSPDFNEERLSKRICKKIDWGKAFRYAKLFNSNTIEAAKECREYVKC